MIPFIEVSTENGIRGGDDALAEMLGGLRRHGQRSLRHPDRAWKRTETMDADGRGMCMAC